VGWITKRRAIVVLATTCALAVAAVAFAYFTTSGSGTATAEAGTSSAVTLHGTVEPETLYPGTSSSVSFEVDNPSEGSQRVGTISLEKVTFDSGHSECNGEWFEMPDVEADQTFPSGEGQSVTATGTLTMENVEASQDACKGAELTLHLTSN
jgi:ABC-type transport system substrate-binding protein